MKALSIRQPWAWLIVNGYKTVENRSRSLGNHTGPLLIHASKTMELMGDYAPCKLWFRNAEGLAHLERVIPSPADLLRGGIVGKVNVIRKLESWHRVDEAQVLPVDRPWFEEEIGYVLRDAKPLPFKACKGRLGFFNVDYEALPS